MTDFPSVWASLKGYKDQSLVGTFQEFVQEEEFEFSTFIDDLHDIEDESTIVEWFKNNGHSVETFRIIKQLIFNPPNTNVSKSNVIDSHSSLPPNLYSNNKNTSSSNKKTVNINYSTNISSVLPPFKNSMTVDMFQSNFKQNKVEMPAQLPKQPSLQADDFMNKIKQDPQVFADLWQRMQNYAGANSVNTSSITASNVNMQMNQSSISQPPGTFKKQLSIANMKDSMKIFNYTEEELNHFEKFCVEEDYFPQNVEEDIDTFEDGDSFIAYHMQEECNWNDRKVAEFVKHLKIALEQRVSSTVHPTYVQSNTAGMNISPTQTNVNNNEHKIDVSHMVNNINTVHKKIENMMNDENISLPKLSKFCIPKHILEQSNERSNKDILECFEANDIHFELVKILDQFLETEECVFEFNEKHASKFKLNYSYLAIFVDYINKCMFELSMPHFVDATVTNKDISNKGNYFERQCPGAIRHDRDLLRYFSLTSATDPDLSVILPDILDRLSIEEDFHLDLTNFSNKPFFRDLDSKQTSYIKNGLRTYHNRFFPRLTLNPVTLIADRISDYQKYFVFFSEALSEYLEDKVSVPSMIDIMIIPPGTFHRNQPSKHAYNAEHTMKIGDIDDNLQSFNIDFKKYKGLPTNTSPVNQNHIYRMFNNLKVQVLEALLQMSGAAKNGKHARICIVIDRRWRINTKLYKVFNRLRCKYTGESLIDANKNAININNNNSNNNSLFSGIKPNFNSMAGDEVDEDTEEDDSGDDDDDDDMLFSSTHNSSSDGMIHKIITDSGGFCAENCDSIFVFQPMTENAHQFHEFDEDYCEETLMYLTKNCILPMKPIGSSAAHKKINKRHIGGDVPDGYLFNVSIHIHKVNKHPNWYAHKMRWYTFMQSASVRFFEEDMARFWPRYFVDGENNPELLSEQEIKKQFKFDLRECDTEFKRWFYSIKRFE